MAKKRILKSYLVMRGHAVRGDGGFRRGGVPAGHPGQVLVAEVAIKHLDLANVILTWSIFII